ncbi:hypothetical protein ABIB26_001969 [Arthrobacter sp. UYEF20]
MSGPPMTAASPRIQVRTEPAAAAVLAAAGPDSGSGGHAHSSRPGPGTTGICPSADPGAGHVLIPGARAGGSAAGVGRSPGGHAHFSRPGQGMIGICPTAGPGGGHVLIRAHVQWLRCGDRPLSGRTCPFFAPGTGHDRNMSNRRPRRRACPYPGGMCGWLRCGDRLLSGRTCPFFAPGTGHDRNMPIRRHRRRVCPSARPPRQARTPRRLDLNPHELAKMPTMWQPGPDPARARR